MFSDFSNNPFRLRRGLGVVCQGHGSRQAKTIALMSSSSFVFSTSFYAYRFACPLFVDNSGQ